MNSDNPRAPCTWERHCPPARKTSGKRRRTSIDHHITRAALPVIHSIARDAKAGYNLLLELSEAAFGGLGSLTKPRLPHRLVNHNGCRRRIVPVLCKRCGRRSRGLVGDACTRPRYLVLGTPRR